MYYPCPKCNSRQIKKFPQRIERKITVECQKCMHMWDEYENNNNTNTSND